MLTTVKDIHKREWCKSNNFTMVLGQQYPFHHICNGRTKRWLPQALLMTISLIAAGEHSNIFSILE